MKFNQLQNAQCPVFKDSFCLVCVCLCVSVGTTTSKLFIFLCNISHHAKLTGQAVNKIHIPMQEFLYISVLADHKAMINPAWS